MKESAISGQKGHQRLAISGVHRTSLSSQYAGREVLQVLRDPNFPHERVKVRKPDSGLHLYLSKGKLEYLSTFSRS